MFNYLMYLKNKVLPEIKVQDKTCGYKALIQTCLT